MKTMCQVKRHKNRFRKYSSSNLISQAQPLGYKGLGPGSVPTTLRLAESFLVIAEDQGNSKTVVYTS